MSVPLDRRIAVVGFPNNGNPWDLCQFLLEDAPRDGLVIYQHCAKDRIVHVLSSTAYRGQTL